MLQGKLSAPATLGGALQGGARLQGTIAGGGSIHPVYDGATEWTPTESAQTVETEGKVVTTDLTIDAIPSEYIVPTGNYAIGASGTHDVAAYASASVAAGIVHMKTPDMDKTYGEIRSKATIDAGYHTGGNYTGSALILDKQAGTTITPTESEQVAVAQYRWTTGAVKVAAIPSQYVVPTGTYTVTGSGTHDVTAYASASVASTTPTNDSESEYITSSGVRKWRYRPKSLVLTAGWAAQRSASNPINGFWVTYDAIPTGTAVTPTTSAQTVGGSDTMMEGAVTVEAIPPQYIIPTGTKSIAANGTGIDVTGYAAVDVAVPSSAPTLQAKTNIAPTTSSQTVTADAGYDGLSSVQIDAMPSGVVVPSSSISTSGGATITTETGKIVLTKTVSNVPQVTTAGYVTSGTFGNTAVTLRADCNINDSSSLTQSGNTVTAAAGYYPNAATLTVSGGSSVKTATGTFTGNGTRTIDVACTFEPDLVYFTSNPGTTASSGTVAAIIVRDMMTATRYRNNSTTNSHYAIPDIAGLNTSGSSYSWRATYANSTVTLYCYSSNARGLLTNGRTYSYTFIKWT